MGCYLAKADLKRGYYDDDPEDRSTVTSFTLGITESYNQFYNKSWLHVEKEVRHSFISGICYWLFERSPSPILEQDHFVRNWHHLRFNTSLALGETPEQLLDLPEQYEEEYE
jgi:hypothetical protein